MEDFEFRGEIFSASKHVGYINSLDIDPVDHQLLLCGGSDSAISIWDLENETDVPPEDKQPLCKLEMKIGHQFGLTKVQWWPFDQSMFLTGSYDNTVKIWDSSALEDVYTFDFEKKVYNFDVNSLELDGLIAVGLSSPLIRLVDLRSTSSAQILKGHKSGEVLSVKWSPKLSYLLASGGSDGSVRVWDIRQATQEVSSMDLERLSSKQLLNPPEFRKAHRGACNGLAWCEEGTQLLSVGMDNKARLWSHLQEQGVNENINFGPLFQDNRQQNLDPLVSSTGEFNNETRVFLSSDTGDVLYYTLNEAQLVQRLVAPGKDIRLERQASFVARKPESYEYYSSARDGSIIKWALI